MLERMTDDQEQHATPDSEAAFATFVYAAVKLLESAGMPPQHIGAQLLGMASAYGSASQGRLLWIEVLKEQVQVLERQEVISRITTAGSA